MIVKSIKEWTNVGSIDKVPSTKRVDGEDVYKYNQPKDRDEQEQMWRNIIKYNNSTRNNNI